VTLPTRQILVQRILKKPWVWTSLSLQKFK
jgi:hypothetical protein